MTTKFPLAFSSFDEQGNRVVPNPWTVCDLRMQDISYALRCKPSWWTRYKDPDVIAKWKAQILREEQDIYWEERLSEEEVDYVIAELAGYHKMRDETTGIQQSCFAQVYESDTLIPEELRQRLVGAVKPLEDVYERKNSSRSRSASQVLNVVDPSLYCGVYGRTFAHPLNGSSSRTGPEEVAQLNPESHAPHVLECPEWAASKKFTWIPTDFDIAKGGQSAKALGYINNIHRTHHSSLYRVIEELVARFSFLWDRVLTDLHPDNPMPYRIKDSFEWEEETNTAPQESDFDDYDDWRSELDDWWKDRQKLRPTVSPEGYTEDISKRQARYSILGRRVQVFVKIFNIQLTPDNPKYLGNSWHVEGMANERIVACGTYCYESENVVETELCFRTAVREASSVDPTWEEESGLGGIHGLHSGWNGAQVLGSVETLAGRCVAFPNSYQHRIPSFKLLDKSKPGHQKIIALFLVDPECPVPSTTHAPPQQSHWTREVISTADTLFAKMPTELLDMVEGAARLVGSLMAPTEAKEYQRAMMKERIACVMDQNKHFFERPFQI